MAPYTAHWNVLGWPAASVPVGMHPTSHTPMAVQIAAPPGNETLIMSIAAQIEEHRPQRATIGA
jgi:amidase